MNFFQDAVVQFSAPALSIAFAGRSLVQFFELPLKMCFVCSKHQLPMDAKMHPWTKVRELVKVDPEVNEAFEDWNAHSMERWRAALFKANVRCPHGMRYWARFAIRLEGAERALSDKPLWVYEDKPLWVYDLVTYDKADVGDLTDLDATIPEKMLATLRSDGKAEQIHDQLKVKLAARVRAITLEVERANGAVSGDFELRVSWRARTANIVLE